MGNKLIMSIIIFVILLLNSTTLAYSITNQDLINSRKIALHEFITKRGIDTTLTKEEVLDLHSFDFSIINEGNFESILSQEMGSRSGESALELYQKVFLIGLGKEGGISVEVGNPKLK
jgi:hypothetical protein